MVEFEKLLYSPDSFFLLRKTSKRVQCSNEFKVLLSHEMLCHAMVSDTVMWWPESVQPPPPLGKSPLAAQPIITFRRL